MTSHLDITLFSASVSSSARPVFHLTLNLNVWRFMKHADITARKLLNLESSLIDIKDVYFLPRAAIKFCTKIYKSNNFLLFRKHRYISSDCFYAYVDISQKPYLSKLQNLRIVIGKLWFKNCYRTKTTSNRKSNQLWRIRYL